MKVNLNNHVTLLQGLPFFQSIVMDEAHGREDWLCAAGRQAGTTPVLDSPSLDTTTNSREIAAVLRAHLRGVRAREEAMPADNNMRAIEIAGRTVVRSGCGFRV